MLYSSTPSHYTPFQEYPFTTNLLQLHSGQTFPAPGRWGKSNPISPVRNFKDKQRKRKSASDGALWRFLMVKGLSAWGQGLAAPAEAL